MESAPGYRIQFSLPFFFFGDNRLEQTAVLKVFFDDNVRHGVEHNFHVLCVCGTGQVGIDFFHSFLHVQLLELQLDVIAGVFICVGAWMGREHESTALPHDIIHYRRK